MKYFFEPSGKFVLEIPIEWQYANPGSGFDEQSPFCFQPYDAPQNGSFQISCYSKEEVPIKKNVAIQTYNTKDLKFIKTGFVEDEFRIHLWFAIVEDHTFIVKYVCDLAAENSESEVNDLLKVEQALSTLELLSEDRREIAVAHFRISNFVASLAASFDLRNKAMENLSLIEMIVILANQIDAYLRMSLMLKKQLDEKSNRLDISLLYQGDTDKAVMERRIYDLAKNEGILSEDLFNQLEKLYKDRNKVVHRYIITDFRTRDLVDIATSYLVLSETICQILKEVEDMQIEKQIGYYGNLDRNYTDVDKRVLHAQVNDKHLTAEFHRKINA
ncbi:hypothetical protein [Pedobacter sp. MC2016-24]|uniref:hypothetical protein n=1 Tax=Pedobacter sp. MC2016-24 TaxID=2780090 RepID=UPI00187E8E6A|nr:hypothetical protein [Pedobacter sp. MC2016-24]MBE9598681.1 hypothetical protein [Pedobacter sp. MC2016-24]